MQLEIHVIWLFKDCAKFKDSIFETASAVVQWVLLFSRYTFSGVAAISLVPYKNRNQPRTAQIKWSILLHIWCLPSS
jgi:hypothetical protein